MSLIALYNFVPHYCPNCGQPTTLFRESNLAKAMGGPVVRADADYRVGASHSCKCGVMFAMAEPEHLKDAADASGSDLSQYIEIA